MMESRLSDSSCIKQRARAISDPVFHWPIGFRPTDSVESIQINPELIFRFSLTSRFRFSDTAKLKYPKTKTAETREAVGTDGEEIDGR